MIEEIYENMQPVGEGAYGIVYRAINKQINKLVAVKIYKENYSRENQAEIMQEIETIKKFNHPNLISLNRYFIFEGRFYLEYPYMEQTLLDYYVQLQKKKISLSLSNLKWIII